MKIFVLIFAWAAVSISMPLLAPSLSQDMAKLRKPYEVGPEGFRTPVNAIELKTIKVFPPESEAADAVTIGGAQDFAEDKLGRFFIPDYRNDEILVFDKEGTFQFRFGETGQGPGDFLKPRDVFVWDDQVLIREVSSLRFQLFDIKGRYLRGFKAFKSYFSFVAGGGRIFAAGINERPQQSSLRSDLIDAMDFDGRVIKSFGTPLDIPQNGYLVLNETNLAIDSNSSLIVGFNFFPILRRYTFEGVLLEEIRFHSAISEVNGPLNDKMFARMYKGEQVPWGFIINDIFCDEDGIYVATATPHRFEILLLDKSGAVSEYYYMNLEKAIGCSQFLVRKYEGRKEFYILKLYPNNSVEVMVRK
jgi:hypothetical protein